MKVNLYEQILKERGIAPTANRLMVLRVLVDAEHSLSLTDLESLLDTIDKSTLFRTITLFLSHRLVHSIDDGTGSLKYAFCESSCQCRIAQLHTHFHCEVCNATFCLKNIPTPVVEVPEGFSINSINYVLKGVCPDCAKKGRKHS